MSPVVVVRRGSGPIFIWSALRVSSWNNNTSDAGVNIPAENNQTIGRLIITRDGRKFQRFRSVGSTGRDVRTVQPVVEKKRSRTRLTNAEARARICAIRLSIRSQRNTAIEVLRELAQAARDLGRSDGTHSVRTSHLDYWEEFLRESKTGVSGFGNCDWISKEDELTSRRYENDILSCFATFVVHRPRISRKKRNSATYAKAVVGNVRKHFEEESGRAPGSDSEHFYSRVLGPLFRGLEKFSPIKEQPRMPILQQHLRLIRENLNLSGSQQDPTLWALWLTQWQGLLRNGDLLSGGHFNKKVWDSELLTHRERLTCEVVAEQRDFQGMRRYQLLWCKTKPEG